MVKPKNLNLDFPLIAFFILAIAFVLLIFSLSPYYQASLTPPPPSPLR